MKKDIFLAELKAALSALPEKEIEDTVSFYNEMITDSIEEGSTEEEAIASVGTIEEIVAQVVDYTPLSKILIEKMKPKKRLRFWEILLLSLGSPIWLSLGIVALAVIFSLWISLWAGIISLWAVFASVSVSSFGCMLVGIVLTAVGRVPEGLLSLSVGLVCSGMGILLFFVCKWITVQFIKLTKKLLLWIKTIFTRNRGDNHA